MFYHMTSSLIMLCTKAYYYIFKAVLILFKVIFEVNSLEVVNPSERKNALSLAKFRTNDVVSKHQTSFQDVKKGKNGHFINVIYT